MEFPKCRSDMIIFFERERENSARVEDGVENVQGEHSTVNYNSQGQKKQGSQRGEQRYCGQVRNEFDAGGEQSGKSDDRQRIFVSRETKVERVAVIEIRRNKRGG